MSRRPRNAVMGQVLGLLEEGAAVSVEAMAVRAYGNSRPEEYEAALRSVVQRLRLHGHSIQATGGGYRLGETTKPPTLRDRSQSVLARIRAQSWQARQ